VSGKVMTNHPPRMGSSKAEFDRTVVATTVPATPAETPHTARKRAVDPVEYVRALRQSKLLSEQRLEELLNIYLSRPDLAMSVPDFLGGADEITPWQQQMLCTGQGEMLRLGGCKVFDALGSGAMSEVYLGINESSGTLVAIKMLKEKLTAVTSLGERFRQEGRLMQQFHHPNLVRCLEMGELQGRCYLVMQYVDGCDLATLVAKRGLPTFAQAANYVAQAARGLAYLHHRRIIHRDIKPANLLLDRQGIVKIFDLGLARDMNSGEHSLTALHHESLLGTPDYMAPEQVLECHQVDRRADLYSLGGTLYFLLTGHPPFNEGTLARRLLKHQCEAPESIYFQRPETPTLLVDTCRKLLAKRPQDRFDSAAELQKHLDDWLAQEVQKPEIEAGGCPQRADAKDDFASLLRWSKPKT